MDQRQITREMIEFNKSVLDKTFHSISALQDQSASMLSVFMVGAHWLPDEIDTIRDQSANIVAAETEITRLAPNDRDKAEKGFVAVRKRKYHKTPERKLKNKESKRTKTYSLVLLQEENALWLR